MKKQKSIKILHKKKDGTMKKFRGFSMVELLVSLIVVSLLAATFAPIITKKMKQANKSVTQGAIIKKKCEGLLDNHWKYKINPDNSNVVTGATDTAFTDNSKYCKLCYREAAKDSSGKNLPYKCLKCTNTCPDGQYLDIETCNCIPCHAVSMYSDVSNGFVYKQLDDTNYKGGFGPMTRTCNADGALACVPGYPINQTDLYSISGTTTKVKTGNYCDEHSNAHGNIGGVGGNVHVSPDGIINQTCPSGSYGDISSSTNLTVNGKTYTRMQYASKFGLTTCTKCPAGSHAVSGYDIYSSSSVSDKGFLKNAAGEYIPCVQCPMGTYQDEEGKASCKSCEPDTYQSYPGKTSCEPVSAGYIAPRTGETRQYLCYDSTDAGTVSGVVGGPGAKRCICKKGYYEAPMIRNKSASYSGKHKTDTNYSDSAAICQPCPAGSVCPDGIKSIKCGQGKYAESASSVSCSDCPANHYCIDGEDKGTCPDGTYSAKGQGSCQQCKSGIYSSTNGCEPCPAGHKCEDGADKGECPAGTFAVAGQGSCQQCPPGTYTEWGTKGNISCTVCPAGSRCPGNGNKYGCGHGYIAPKEGATTCQQCPPGTYGVDSLNCTPCPIGQYNPYPAQSTCKAPMGPYYAPFAGTVTPLYCDTSKCTKTNSSCTCPAGE